MPTPCSFRFSHPLPNYRMKSHQSTKPLCFLMTAVLVASMSASTARAAAATQPSADAALSITDSFLQTSFRKGEVWIDLAGQAEPGQALQVAARLSSGREDAAPVRSFDAVQVIADQDGGWTARLTTPLEGLALWSRQHPNLYHYTVEITSPGREQVVQQPPRRVGLREVWIQDGSFILNGQPLVIVDDVWSRSLGGNRKQVEIGMRQAKAMGFSGGRLSDKVHLEVADEVGMPAIVNCGSFVRFNIWDPRSGLTRMDGDERREDIIRTVRNLREHPSIISWSSAAPYSLASMHPEYAGQYFNTWAHFPLNRFAQTGREGQHLFRELVEMVGKLDATRPVASHNGPFSPIEVATRYLCDNLDLQEREEFFDFWYRSGPERKVVWPSEVGMPFAGHQFIRYIDHQMPQGGLWPKIHLENLARLIGYEAYGMEAEENFPNWLRQNFYPMMQWPAAQRLTAINVRHVWRAYRTYGVNVSAHHILNENAFGPITGDRNKREGLTNFPVAGVDEVTEAARSYLDAITPVLGYIGGPDTRFTSKDHLYFAAQPVRKSFIVINDLDEPAVIDGQWRLVDAAGNAVFTGQLSGSVEAGRRALTQFPIEFAAPAVEQRADFVLEVNCTPRSQALLQDRFTITVFPQHRPRPFEFDGTVWTVNISDDYTHESPHFFINRDNHALLEAAGVSAKLLPGFRTFAYHGYSPDAAQLMHGDVRRRGQDPLPGRQLVTDGQPAPGDLLIIPRQTLASGQGERELTRRALERLKLDELVEQGLRVLVLEQDLPNIMGINTETTRPRRTFISASGHPVFAGLQDSDLTYWSGDSNLAAPITPYSAGEQRFPERLWNTSNTNTVSTRPLVRPQVGAARALVVSGFDLQETPLLEVVRGRGRIIFCQLDVTSRYGTDPAATRLLDNLLAYLAAAPEPQPGKAGVEVVASGPQVQQRGRVFRSPVPEGRDGWGITPGELFFRESIYDRNRITKSLPARSWPVFAEAGAGSPPRFIRAVEGGYQTTLAPALFETGWMKRKAAWIHAALRINAGASSGEGPQLRHHGHTTVLYPYEWVEQFVHPYTANIW
jgi:beta-galactosidase